MTKEISKKNGIKKKEKRCDGISMIEIVRNDGMSWNEREKIELYLKQDGMDFCNGN